MSHRIDPALLTPDVLLRAYSIGLFPMAESADDPHLFWVDPPLRGIFPLNGILVSRSLAKSLRSERFSIRIDTDFDAVIEACAQPRLDRPNTWINAGIRSLYRRLFDRGYVHTVEVYQADALVGGLYGVTLGGAFFGESMFHRVTDASKVALVHLAARLRLAGYVLLDTQFVTPHLATLGAIEMPRAEYRVMLDAALRLQRRFPPSHFEPIGGRDALAALL